MQIKKPPKTVIKKLTIEIPRNCMHHHTSSRIFFQIWFNTVRPSYNS